MFVKRQEVRFKHGISEMLFPGIKEAPQLFKFFLIFRLFFFFEGLAISAKANKFAHDHLLEGEFVTIAERTLEDFGKHHGIGYTPCQTDMTGSGDRVETSTTRGEVTHDDTSRGVLGDHEVIAIQRHPIGPETTRTGTLATGKGTDNSIISHH
tara:strand:- start:298 stop:756 length:459 start_codon:yes stop_codon:yes gene_type:complete